jgi:hypothetical protein
MLRIPLLLFAFATAMACVPLRAQQAPRRLPGPVRLYGPVQTIREEHSTFTPQNGGWLEGPRLLQMVWAFSEDGTKQDLTYYQPNGQVKERWSITYNPDGRLLESRSFNTENVLVTREVRRYDEKEQLIERVTYRADDSIASRTVYSNNGAQFETIEYDLQGTEIRETRSTRTTQDRRTDFDSLSVQANGTATRQETSEIWRPDGSHGYQYQDSSGRFDCQEVRLAEKGTFERVFCNRDGTVLRRERFVQEFDLYGNMTKSSNSSAKGQAHDLEPTGVTYRTITYYSNN